MTIKNRYPLPLIRELIDKLKKKKWFSKFDVRWGYNNIRIKEGDEWKVAFRTNRGLFEPTVMFFGLTNSPATFQSFMNHILRELIDEGKVVVYLDDILVFTETLEEHRIIVKQVLQILKENKLSCKAEKCEFEQTKVDFLGVVIQQGQVHMDPAKVSAVADWPTPKNAKEIRTFLGFINFYRRFIKDFAKMSRHLTPLTGKIKWEWTDKQQKAFEELRHAVTDKPILHLPIDDGQYKMETDGSGMAMGAVLMQQQPEEHETKASQAWKTLAYYSATFSKAERNYTVEDRELLAIVLSLLEWRQYLLGAPEFEIWTDHKNLQFFKEPHKINRRQARWVTEVLSQFHFTL
jgi:hypothetical protein